MIASLRGKPVARTAEGLVLDVGGVGYLVHATPSALARARDAAETTLQTYLAVREDALQLYGFADAEERGLFVHLLAVNGVGPKVALAVVSGSPAGELRRAIALGGEARYHVRLDGPPGHGKTSLAYIVREELGVGIRTVAGPALERKGDIAAILTSLGERDVLFVDEIHRLNRAVEEILYPALEDFRLDIVVGQGPAARTLTLDLPRFTLVGATTRTGLLTTPLRDRFGMTYRLEYYEPADLARIVRRSARILEVEIADEAADEIARRSRGTPRIANRILRRVRDVAQVRHDGTVTLEIAREALELLEVDGHGLERMDRDLLAAILEQCG